jgi:hypothetical protein
MLAVAAVPGDLFMWPVERMEMLFGTTANFSAGEVGDAP